MNLKEFLKEVKEKECGIIEYKGKRALEAVRQNGYALMYVKEQTEEICLEAVRQNGYALLYVKEQNEEICLEAVKQDGYALQYVKEQNEEICLEAVKQNGYALRYVNKNIFDSKTELTLKEIADIFYEISGINIFGTKTELTLKEIADKFNIDINDLRIKEEK